MTTATADSQRLGDLLISESLISKEQLDQALSEQRSSGMRLGYVLVKMGFVRELEITKMLAKQYRVPAVDLTRFEVDERIVKLIPADVALKHSVLPLKRDGRTLTVAMADPSDMQVIDDLNFITRCDIFPVIAGEFTLRITLGASDRMPALPTFARLVIPDIEHHRPDVFAALADMALHG